LPKAAEGIRIDTGVREGDQITFHYDPMIAKVVSYGSGRDEAIERMLSALSEIQIDGVTTNAAFLRRAIGHPAFRAGDTHTGFVTEHGASLLKG
jgi:3-methylcrotonyl-CoA carboxylase alpha subunit